ncbi:MAG: ComEC/Rec2 family competence protein, partial [Elusimicrobiota bacterium]
NKIGSEAVVVTAGDWVLLERGRGPLAWLAAWRESMLAGIHRDFGDAPTAGFIAGLTLGDKRMIGDPLKRDFIRSGTMHLLVVSGLHVSLLAAAVFYVLLFLRMRRAWAVGVSLICIWLLYILCGSGTPILRGAVMYTALLAAPLFKRDMPALTRLFVTALVFLIAKPSWLWDASFVLSFAATFGVIYSGLIAEPYISSLLSPRRGVRAACKRAAYRVLSLSVASVSVWFVLLPAQVGYFHGVSLVAPLANLTLVPLSVPLLIHGLVHVMAVTHIPWLGSGSSMLLAACAERFIRLAVWLGSGKYAYLDWADWSVLLWAAWGLAVLTPVSHMLLSGVKVGGYRRSVILAGLSLCMVIAHGSVRYLRSPRFALLRQGSGYVALYADDGALCYAPEDDGFVRRQWGGFLASRGHPQAVNVCDDRRGSRVFKALPGAFPFAVERQQVRVDCAGYSLIFPLSSADGQDADGSFSEVPIIRHEDYVCSRRVL